MPFYKFRLFFFLVPLFSLLLFSCKKDPIDTDGSNTPGTFSVDIGNSTIPYITIDTREAQSNMSPRSKHQWKYLREAWEQKNTT
jgi:hypothetical protein